MTERKEGSSPLTRGKRTVLAVRFEGLRLIPAHAGKTLAGSSRIAGPPAHPRSRGENVLRLESDTQHMGSSPLTRGKPSRGSPSQRSHRLIPAHAGKTACNVEAFVSQQAHPRSRGENQAHAVTLDRVAGSSPLTRGKRDHNLADTNRPGLIPAHAGKTSAVARWGRCPRAHPRSRGENEDAGPIGAHTSGSSPLTRGKPPP